MAEVSENGNVVGRLPYFLFKKMGVAIVDLPTITHFLGPAVISAKPLRRLEITKELIDKLPPVSALYIKCHRDVQDVIAFQSAGYSTSVQFTHEIHPQPTDVLWKTVQAKTRRVIRRASECHSVSAGNDPLAFMQFYRKNIEDRGKTNSIDINICTRLIQACLEGDRGRIFESERSGWKFGVSNILRLGQVVKLLYTDRPSSLSPLGRHKPSGVGSDF